MEKKGFSTRHFSGREAAHSGVTHTRKSVLYTKKVPHKDEKEFSEHKTQYLEIPHKIPQNRRPAPLHRPVEKPSRYHGNKKSPFMQKTRKKSSPERTLLKRQRAKILTISLLCIFAFSACDDSESDSRLPQETQKLRKSQKPHQQTRQAHQLPKHQKKQQRSSSLPTKQATMIWPDQSPQKRYSMASDGISHKIVKRIRLLNFTVRRSPRFRFLLASA